MKFEEALNLINEGGRFEVGFRNGRNQTDEINTNNRGVETYINNGVPADTSKKNIRAVLNYLKNNNKSFYEKISTDYDLDTPDVIFFPDGRAKVTTDDGSQSLVVNEKSYSKYLEQPKKTFADKVRDTINANFR